MNLIFLAITVAILLLLLPYMWRAIVGPTVFDRLQALNGIGTKVPVLLVFIGLAYGRVEMFIDLALSLFLLNLFTTLLVAKYMETKGEI